MRVIIALLGTGQIIVGILVYGAAVSAIHEILGAILFGLGTMCVALSVVIGKLELILESSKGARQEVQKFS